MRNSLQGTEVRKALIGSIVIPAHNEEAVIGHCLDALSVPDVLAGVEIVVVCNGCSDRTAETARLRGAPLGVRVLNLVEPSKAAALRAGDAAVTAYPRAYLDADVVAPAEAVISVFNMLSEHPTLRAARPPIQYDHTRATAPVRAFYRARSRTPELMSSLWGGGFYALNAQGRARWGQFPDVGQDDLYVDSLFSSEEKGVANCPPVVVRTPRTTRALLHTLRRVYRREVGSSSAAPPSSLSTLGAILRANHTSAGQLLDVAVYVTLAVGARVADLLSPSRSAWERDESTRESPAQRRHVNQI